MFEADSLSIIWFFSFIIFGVCATSSLEGIYLLTVMDSSRSEICKALSIWEFILPKLDYACLYFYFGGVSKFTFSTSAGLLHEKKPLNLLENLQLEGESDLRKP